MLCLLDFMWLLIMLVLMGSSSLHTQQNIFPFETTKYSSEYRDFLKRCWGVTDLGSLQGFGPLERLWKVAENNNI